ncbi:hypothetical protein M501DRAFT_604824 [Patellaria atrata CBS 101060]|uniref:Uncharacterized protein n=1 Tax=Patellaria atrata CBS 101060 TaxID=1346257 RepID=A0A9P4S131_9PEZI|nr:hypothetical protein M501DRAFT_604824 [Patellaria atrata CBS 101060]
MEDDASGYSIPISCALSIPPGKLMHTEQLNHPSGAAPTESSWTASNQQFSSHQLTKTWMDLPGARNGYSEVQTPTIEARPILDPFRTQHNGPSRASHPFLADDSLLDLDAASMPASLDEVSTTLEYMEVERTPEHHTQKHPPSDEEFVSTSASSLSEQTWCPSNISSSKICRVVQHHIRVLGRQTRLLFPILLPNTLLSYFPSRGKVITLIRLVNILTEDIYGPSSTYHSNWRRYASNNLTCKGQNIFRDIQSYIATIRPIDSSPEKHVTELTSCLNKQVLLSNSQRVCLRGLYPNDMCLVEEDCIRLRLVHKNIFL